MQDSNPPPDPKKSNGIDLLVSVLNSEYKSAFVPPLHSDFYIRDSCIQSFIIRFTDKEAQWDTLRTQKQEVTSPLLRKYEKLVAKAKLKKIVEQKTALEHEFTTNPEKKELEPQIKQLNTQLEGQSLIFPKDLQTEDDYVKLIETETARRIQEIDDQLTALIQPDIDFFITEKKAIISKLNMDIREITMQINSMINKVILIDIGKQYPKK